MLKKSGKFLADWRDSKGRRCRKAFTTKKQATKYQTKMRTEAAAKKARASGPQRKS